MAEEPIQIKRYPNRRYYARHASKYVSLQDLETMVRDGHTVEIRDSQSGEDITRQVLVQILLDRQPEKMALFPSDMLHFILRSNDLMADFLRDYFRHALTYLDYLQRQKASPNNLVNPMHWVQACLDGFGVQPRDADATSENEDRLARRVEELEERMRELEAKQRS